ncbi:MAG: Chaperone NapD [Gammaproteobacteria bacterium]|nr:Chaperone NapD [Gammaproteobacteria bacterium]
MDCLVSERVHITSLVVHARPAKWKQILTQVKRLPTVEVHTGDTIGKFVVLLETQDEEQILDAIDRIQEIDGVLSATMVYHHIDE